MTDKDKDEQKADKNEDEKLDKDLQDKTETAPKAISKQLLIILLSAFSLLLIITMILLVLLFKSDPVTPAAPHKSSATSDSAAIKEDAAPEPKNPAMFFKIEPAFIVNFEGSRNIKFLQVTVEVMTRDKPTLKYIEDNLPIIKNDLVTLFSAQQYSDVSLSSGRESLRKKALQVIANIIEKEAGFNKVEEVLFTSFVMQ